MAVRETEEEVRARLAQIAPGARVSSAERTPERQAQLIAEWERGGRRGQRPATNSLHLARGEDGGSRALDIVPGSSGLSMAQLNQRLGTSGLNFQERLNEGDHVHVGIDGRPSTDRQAGAPTWGTRDSLTPGEGVPSAWLQAQGIDAQRFGSDVAYAQRQMGAMGYVNRDGVWGRPEDAPDTTPAPMDQAYAQRQEQRETLALDQEEAGLMMAVQAQPLGDAAMGMAGAVARDVGKGVLLEGGKAVLSGAGRAVNETLDLVDEVGDWIERTIPGTLMWEGFDGDASTPMRIRLTTQNDAQARIDTANNNGPLARLVTGGKAGDGNSWWQRLGQGQLRVPDSEEGRPESTTGRIIEGVSQFATGFVGAGKVLKGWRVASRGGQIGKALVQGALADFTAFDGNEARLSNLLAEHAPDAIAPMFEALAAREDDPEIIGRLKNAVEGAGLGGATELILGGIRALRASRLVKDEARAAAQREGLQEDPTVTVDEAAVRGQELQDTVRSAMGNPTGPRFRARPERPAAEAPVITPFQTKIDDAAAVTDPVVRRAPGDPAASTDNVFDINLARINTPEDVQAAIVGMADRFAKDADLARRGTRTWEQTREAANGVDWVASMGARQPGQAVNAETALAYRTALNSSATQLLDLARKVEAEPTLANQFAFRRATAAHYAIQNELLGARAEAGRALNAFKIQTDAPATYLRQVDSLIADAGGANSAQELARRVIDAAKAGDAELNQMVRGGAMARTRDIVKLVYTNGLLSGAGTSIINTVGNSMVLAMNLASRSLSPRMARAFGGQASTQVGEASALVHGYQQALRDMFRLNPVEAATRIGANGGEALRRDGVFRGMAPGLDDAAPDGIQLRAQREEAGQASGRPLSAGAWRVNEDTPLGRVLDIFQMFWEAPSNINALSDDFFKTIAARGELHAQAHRRVVNEGLEGEALRARYADLIRNPDDDMLAAAEREMHDLTFTRETPGMADAFSRLRRHMDDNPTPIPFGTIMLPFIKTPANLISMGVRYSPLAHFSRRFTDDLKAGGAAAETAKARMAIGTALWSVWMGAALDGNITGAGPGNPGQRDAMQRQDEFGGSVFQPYSVRVGDRWFSYERADPMGQGMALVADTADLMKNGDWDSDRNGEADEIMAHGVMALGQAFFDKTMLRSASEFTAAILNGTDAEAERLLMNRASGAIPGSSALRMSRRGEDPYLRETWNVASALRNTIPGLSDDLPLQRDLWGKPRTYQTGLGTLYDAVVPVQTRAAGGSAIDLEILNNGVSVAMPSRNINVMGETVSLKNRPDIYSEYLRLSGEPAFEHLNAVVEGNHPDSEFYLSLSDGPDGGKAEYIRDVISAYRTDARAQVLDMYSSDLQGMAAERTRRREQVRVGE